MSTTEEPGAGRVAPPLSPASRLGVTPRASKHSVTMQSGIPVGNHLSATEGAAGEAAVTEPQPDNPRRDVETLATLGETWQRELRRWEGAAEKARRTKTPPVGADPANATQKHSRSQSRESRSETASMEYDTGTRQSTTSKMNSRVTDRS